MKLHCVKHFIYHFVFCKQEVQETVLRLVRTADQLLRRSNLDVEGVRQRLQTVDQECESFMYKLDTRRKNITMATTFFEQAESVSMIFINFVTVISCKKLTKE